MFKDRVDAGRRLASKLTHYSASKPVVLAIPRGGLVVAFEVAKALRAPMSLVFPRKIRAPSNPELAIGAVAEDGTMILDDSLVKDLGVDEEYLKEETSAQIEEIKRRKKRYRAPVIPVEGRVVIVVDDGIATGATVRAAVGFLKNNKPDSVVVAVPVAPPNTISVLRAEADEVICLHSTDYFFAIGQFYEEFEQLSDEEVDRILEESKILPAT
ncbi:MAG: phosphoribosyltransferase [Thaumarchaeota archaeon]|nr:phosphoribosyltransferase [Nitrososphaerota archaeon]